MKNTSKLKAVCRITGIIALTAIIGLALVGCPNPGDYDNKNPQIEPPQTVTYVSTDNDNTRYTLTITENTNGSRAAYAPQNGDSFVLTVELFNDGNYAVSLTCSGAVQGFGGTTLNLQLSVNNAPLTITIENGNMTVISGTIVSDDGQKEIVVDESITLTPVIDKTYLQAAIATANAARNGVVTSANGNDVPTTVYWVTQSQMETFTTAIATAQAIYDDANVNQYMVDYAKIVLDTATTAFNGHKRAGSKAGAPIESDYDVVIFGSTWDYSTFDQSYWKYKSDEPKEYIPFTREGRIFSHAVDGNDLYFVGDLYDEDTDSTRAVYWKNGVRTFLSTGFPGIAVGDKRSGASGITIVDGNIYIAGKFIYKNNEDISIGVVCYWKNGVRTDLATVQVEGADGATHINLISTGEIAVNGNDVYILGSLTFDYWGNISTQCYWKNGTRTDFPNDICVRNNIAVTGPDVHFAGYDNNGDCCYWRNNARHILPGGSKNQGIRKIAVSGNDIYVIGNSDTGSVFKACYWKNGTKVDLDGGTGDSYATDIVFVDGNVFIAGETDSSYNTETNTSTSTVCYWLNGVVKILLPDQVNSGVLALSVKKKNI